MGEDLSVVPPPDDLRTRLRAEERAVSSAGARSVRTWPDRLRATVRSASRDRITTSAGSLSFHWFLAIFPAIVALTGIASLVGLSGRTLDSVVHGVGIVLPNGVSQVLTEALRRPVSARASVLEVVFGLAVALWSGVESMAALQVGLDLAYEVETDRGFVGRRLMALPLLAATVVLGATAFALVVLGPPIATLVHRDVPLAGAVLVLFDVARLAGALVAVMLLMSVFYALGPNRPHLHFRWVTPGSLVATLGWLLASVLFSVYLNDFGHEATSYGAFADIAISLLWLFLAAIAVLVGAELDHVLEHEGFRPPPVGEPDPAKPPLNWCAPRDSNPEPAD